MRRTDLYEIKFQNLKYKKKTFKNTYRYMYHCFKKDVLKKWCKSFIIFIYFFFFSVLGIWGGSRVKRYLLCKKEPKILDKKIATVKFKPVFLTDNRMDTITKQICLLL